MQPDWQDFPHTEPTTPARGRRVWMGCVSLLLIAALLLSSASGAVWLLRQWRARAAAPQPTRQPAEIAAAPSTPPAAEREPEAASTAVSPTASLTRTLTVNRIAYIDRDGQVATTAPDGSGSRQLTDTDLRFQFPAWSPDGERLAAIGSSRGGAGIYLLRDEAATAEPEPRYFSRTENPFYLYWSPDRSQIGFLANDAENGIALRLTSADGETESRVLATGSPLYWHWTADGAQILAHSGAAGTDGQIMLLDAAGDGAPEAIAQPGLFQAPAISADGRFFAYATDHADGVSWLTLQGVDGQAVFSEPHPGSTAFAWHPARNLLAVINGRPESTLFYGPLRLLDADSGELRLLSAETVVGFFWSPDGRYLAYLSTPALRDDVQASAAPWRAPAAAPRAGLARLRPQPAAQPSTPELVLRLVDVTSGEDRLLTRFQPSFIFLSQFLPFFDQYAHSHSLWAPDSTALVLPMREAGSNYVVVVPVSGEPPERLLRGDMPFWSRQ
ncbi:MAG: PD40 domain-containing protein [Anaerolineales bacterium]|nr:PD40 domain-containing protein [Anaerolineales bacterium]